MSAPLTQAARAVPSADDISQRIETLRADLTRRATTVAGDMSDGLDEAGRKISRKFSQKIGQTIGQTGRDARATARDAVVHHPLTAIGLAAGLGLALGLMARRG